MHEKRTFLGWELDVMFELHEGSGQILIEKHFGREYEVRADNLKQQILDPFVEELAYEQ